MVAFGKFTLIIAYLKINEGPGTTKLFSVNEHWTRSIRSNQLEAINWDEIINNFAEAKVRKVKFKQMGFFEYIKILLINESFSEILAWKILGVRAGTNQDFTPGAREAKATTDTMTPKEDNSPASATLEDQNIRGAKYSGIQFFLFFCQRHPPPTTPTLMHRKILQTIPPILRICWQPLVLIEICSWYR
jgi:hypothetical protein